MGEWFAENWYIVLLLVIYLVERSPEVLKSLKQVAERKAAERELEKLTGSANDSPATADDKQKPSLGRRVATGALHLLPFITRIKRMSGK